MLGPDVGRAAPPMRMRQSSVVRHCPADHFVQPGGFVTAQEDSQVVPLFDQLIGDE